MNNIEEIQNHIKEARTEMKKLQAELSEKTKKLFHEGIKSLFDQCPEVNYIHFTAYTPYFNDGEECTYRCGADDCGFNGYCYAAEEDTRVISAFGVEPTVDILLKSRETIYVLKPNPNYNPNISEWSGNNRKTISESVRNPDYDVCYLKIKDAFRSLLKSISDDTWREIVGEGVIVMINREGFHIKDYTSHD